ncbi:chitobiase/beta-hexosaminidase C-terminal domain-containing protein [uncultured Winogradskyella sp.]|uniref:chitobiase/beta-hexosaminidase C-terminal domain-containing protein n=1 Tax=uncultured Winogradskyella sp. TaxID=395353 RepID=UPI002607F997|nr:chitobiase/beta-hexosaminidase C-terminal domain-containing protein [uncultured Winogradskyella sp.]
MRKLVVLFVGVFILSCSNEKEQKTNFVQEDTIELAQPRVIASSRIIDSSVVIKADLKMEGIIIRYTENEEEPTEKSKIYKNQLEISKAGNYNFKAFHSDWKQSSTTSLKVFEGGILPPVFSWKTIASKSYPGQGAQTLINNKLGGLNFKDSQWMGFDTTAVAVIDFKIPKRISKLSVSYLVDTKSWIFPPENVSVIVNQKDTISVNIPKLPEGKYKQLDAVVIPIDREIETLKINVVNTILPSWHPSNGNNAWLFMDEWIFNE